MKVKTAKYYKSDLMGKNKPFGQPNIKAPSQMLNPLSLVSSSQQVGTI